MTPSKLTARHFLPAHSPEHKVAIIRNNALGLPPLEELNEILNGYPDLKPQLGICAIEITPSTFTITVPPQTESASKIISNLQKSYTNKELFEFLDARENECFGISFSYIAHLALAILKEKLPSKEFKYHPSYIEVSIPKKTMVIRSINVNYKDMTVSTFVKAIEAKFKDVKLSDLSIEMIEAHVLSHVRIAIRPTVGIQETYTDVVRELLREKAAEKVLYCNAYRLSEYFTKEVSLPDQHHSLEIVRCLLREAFKQNFACFGD